MADKFYGGKAKAEHDPGMQAILDRVAAQQAEKAARRDAPAHVPDAAHKAILRRVADQSKAAGKETAARLKAEAKPVTTVKPKAPRKAKKATKPTSGKASPTTSSGD